MRSGQTIPQACQVVNEWEAVIPAKTLGVPLGFNLKLGQSLSGSQAFFQPSPKFYDLGLMVCEYPLLEKINRVTNLLVQNPQETFIRMSLQAALGYLIDSSSHEFELIIPE